MIHDSDREYFINLKLQIMKKFLCFMFIAFAVACTQEKKSPLEGTWKLVGFEYYENGNLAGKMPGQIKFDQLKAYSKNYFVFSGHYEMDTLKGESYGNGTYTYDGKNCVENILFHKNKNRQGTKVNLPLEIRNDSMILKVGSGSNTYTIEKYVKVE